MASIVFGCDDLRREILSYLRTDAYSRCNSCRIILQWDPWHPIKRPQLYGYCFQCMWGPSIGCGIS